MRTVCLLAATVTVLPLSACGKSKNVTAEEAAIEARVEHDVAWDDAEMSPAGNAADGAKTTSETTGKAR
jgi:hypothetical protein